MNIIGDVQGKKCILIDDMIDTAGTITLAANALKELGFRFVLKEDVIQRVVTMDGVREYE